MTEKVVAQKGPYRLETHPGTHWWCRCGRSEKQPFCDGSHMGTGLMPLKGANKELTRELPVSIVAQVNGSDQSVS